MLRATVCVMVLTMASFAPAAPLDNIKVVNDRAPDCSSLKAIVDTVTRDCRTDDERVIAIYNFGRYVYYHHACPNEPGNIGALKMINVYGWGLCGSQHTVLAALWEAAGYKYRYRGWSNPGHTTVEVFYGDRWHYLDTFLKFYAWMPDPAHAGKQTIAGQDDILANPALVTDAFVMDEARKVCYQTDNRFDRVGKQANWTAPAFMVCGDDLPSLIKGVRSSKVAGTPRGWSSIKFDDPTYTTAVNLAPGFSLTLDWDRIDGAWYFRGGKQSPRHTCGDKDYRNCPAIGPLLEPYMAKDATRTWSNGTLFFRADLRNAAGLAGFRHADNVVGAAGSLRPQDAAKPASVVLDMSSPYVAVKAEVKIGGEAKVEVSIDGKTFQPVELAKLSEAINGKYSWQLRLTFNKPLTELEVKSIVQHNSEALPYLAPGKNTITISADNAAALGDNRLLMTYAYCLGTRTATPEDLCDGSKEIARGHNVSWSSEPIVVQKVIDKLPATIEIPVPTAKGKHPAYPRMLFLWREVLAPGQEPLPVPARPTTPTVGPNEQLTELPNPWLIGARPPVKQPARPTKTATLQPNARSFCSKQGQVSQHQFIKWLKDNSDAWIMLVGFDKTQLPAADQLASAKLVVYVEEAHDKAPMQVAAVSVDAPFIADKPFDFAALGATAGTAIVEKGNGPGAAFNPPRRYEIDVTKAVRAWAAGYVQRTNLAVRIVPNRSVDDGWTVRFTPAKEKPAELLISTYAEPQ